MKYLIAIITIGFTGCVTRPLPDGDARDFSSISKLSRHELAVLIDMNDHCDVGHKVRSFFMEDESRYIYWSRERDAIRSLHEEGLIEGYETIRKTLGSYESKQISPHQYVILTGDKKENQVKRDMEECYYSLSPKGRRAVQLCIGFLSEKLNERKRQQEPGPTVR